MKPHFRSARRDARRSPNRAAVAPRPGRALAAGLLLALGLCGAATAGEAAGPHLSWRECLSRSFAVQSALTSRELAADAALRACRDAEAAYLVALSQSPLMDAGDVARARPALAARARSWLFDGAPAAQHTALR